MKHYKIATTKEVKPQGWLKEQLQIQARGLSGNLDKIWPDIKDSAWIGGKCEGWERVPYWLDGFVVLAYLLDDEDMKSRAKKYIDAILENQKTDGWICPCDDNQRKKYDTWAVQLISKVLVVYYECSLDERIPNALYLALKNYYSLLKAGEIKLFYWGKYRWFETFIALDFLYEKYHEEWIIELAKILEKQGCDYSKKANKWKKPKNKWRYDTHVVNIAMMLKEEAVTHNLLGENAKGKAETLFDILQKYNGTCVGTLTGDECLSGLSPIQGTELCSVVELMYSYELLYAYSQNAKWANLLELAAFNALPATISEDMWTHQYDQMVNQIACRKLGKKVIFRTNGGESHLFGLEPNFGCCTANFNQAFPKLTLATFMECESTVLNAITLPSKYCKNGIRINLDTNYPFENALHYHIESEQNFTFEVRIPSFAKNLKVNGVKTKKYDVLSFDITENSKTVIDITFDCEIEIVNRPNDLKCIKYGSLVFSLPIEHEKKMYEYKKDGVERKYPYCDYELIARSEWQYAIKGTHFEIEKRDNFISAFSESNPPITLNAKVQKIGWGLEKGYDSICSKVPKSTTPQGDVVDINLKPYGCSKLRITEMVMI